MAEILSITNGTDEVTLIGSSSTFQVTKSDGYLPGIPQGKTTWHNPALADGRQLTSWSWQNNIDSYKLFMKSGTDQDTAAGELRNLITLLVQAIAYRPTEWNTTPVYVKRKADNATNTEYALIEGWSMPGYNSPFSYLFRQLRMKGLQLTLELAHWGDNPPGTSTALPIGILQSYNGRNYGNVNAAGTLVPTTAQEVFCAPISLLANITNHHIGTSATNLLDSSPPYACLGATGSTYFGTATSVANAVPPIGLIFNLDRAAAGTYTLIWEYYNSFSTSWISFTPLDNTNNFQNLGVNAIVFPPLPDQGTLSPGGSLPTGYWYRVRVASGSLSTTPRQATRKVYAPAWPYIKIDANNIQGDIPALAKIKITNVGADNNGSTSYSPATQVALGLRSLSRGSNFTPILNFAQANNPTGITVSENSPDSSFVADTSVPAGEVIRVSKSSTSESTYDIFLDRTIASHFGGRFRMLLVSHSGFGLDVMSTKVTVMLNSSSYLNGEVIHETDYVPHPSGGTFHLLDFGQVHIPTYQNTQLANIRFLFTSYLENYTSGSSGNDMAYFILLPVDEFSAHSNSLNFLVSTCGPDDYLEIDSIQPKGRTIKATLREISNDDETATWKINSNGPAIIQANSDQMLCFLPITEFTLYPGTYSLPPSNVCRVEIETLQRYLSPRGNS